MAGGARAPPIKILGGPAYVTGPPNIWSAIKKIEIQLAPTSHNVINVIMERL